MLSDPRASRAHLPCGRSAQPPRSCGVQSAPPPGDLYCLWALGSGRRWLCGDARRPDFISLPPPPSPSPNKGARPPPSMWRARVFWNARDWRWQPRRRGSWGGWGRRRLGGTFCRAGGSPTGVAQAGVKFGPVEEGACGVARPDRCAFGSWPGESGEGRRGLAPGLGSGRQLETPPPVGAALEGAKRWCSR